MATTAPVLTGQALTVLLAALRLAPTIAFAPPFTLVKVPAMVRVVIVMALAACLPASNAAVSTDSASIILAACSELALGLAMALPLQLAFAMIGMAGRALDIQAGFGLAFLIDPKTKAQMPLIGALFTYAAAAVFFLTSGPADLLTVFGASFARIPVGTALAPHSAGVLVQFLGTVSVLALGLVGLAVTVLFLIDLTVAMMSRTLPQMNVLVFGFQIKSIVTLLLLPMTIGYAGAGIVRIIRLAIEAMPGMG